MKKTLAIVLLLSATTSAYAVDSGAVLGGALGGAAGAAVGHSMGGQNGAILGAAIGGGTGAAIGSSSAAPQQVQPAQVKVTTAKTAKRHRDDKEKDHHDHGRKHDKDHDD
ncbi:MAG: hypothetical protein Q7U78_05695 [Gallionella sp.]|nr:hypothetical protein [Gallionella sp.]